MNRIVTLAALISVATATPALANKDMKAHSDKWFSKEDANNDGKITRTEHQAFGDQMFKDMDANGDGNVSRDEMMAYHEKKKDMYGKDMSPSAGGSIADQSDKSISDETNGNKPGVDTTDRNSPQKYK